MFHPQMWRLDQLIAVLIPRERAEPMLEALEHRLHLLELFPRRVGVIVQWPEIERELSLLALVRVGEMCVVAGIHRDVVVVYRIRDEPLVGRRALRIGIRAPQPAIGDVGDRARHRDRDALAVRLIGAKVFVRPPHARANAFVGGSDPRPA